MRDGAAARRGWKWNELNFKRLGKVRVIIFKNIFAIVVPVDLSSNVLGNRWCLALYVMVRLPAMIWKL